VVADLQPAGTDAQLDRGVLRAELDGVVEQVADRAQELLRLGDHLGGLGVDHDGAAAAAARPVGGALGEPVQRDGLLGLVVVAVHGERHQLVHQPGELPQLAVEVGQDLVAGGGGHADHHPAPALPSTGRSHLVLLVGSCRAASSGGRTGWSAAGVRRG
jgi:hypothetical protein